MNLAQRCDEIIRMIDEVLAAEAAAELPTGNARSGAPAHNVTLGWPGPEARR
jgi:hypothetical protein